MEKTKPSNNIFLEFIKFFPDLIWYIGYRGRQIVVWSYMFIELGGVLFTNVKKEIVKRMFWGRNSFYKKFFHFAIVFITGLTFLNGVTDRLTVNSTNTQGLNVAQGQAGFSDILQQYANSKSFTVRTGEELPFEVVEHTVEEGETLSEIAEQYSLSDVSPIQWANSMGSSTKIEPGKVLKIPPMQGVLKEAKSGDTARTLIKGVTDANLIDVLELNDLDDPDEIVAEGQLIFIPNGSIPVVIASSRGRGSSVVYNFNDPGIEVAPGTFINPLSHSSCVGSTYSRGWATWHTGVDVAKRGGCWIVASAPGTVSRRRWCGSAGYCVTIKHANGLSTLYAHGNGQFAVNEGQTVQAGQRIMYMGNTGHSFGTHLHFSLAANNNDVLNCYRCRINPAGIVPF